ncbi:tRNA-dihydrouridine synthase B [Candidatus Zixiibacteriota bacterium]|nr:tRNA-dihydrouridine synthase B [candidate division Zixibacteria bacterium]
MRIGNLNIGGTLFLAPLAGISNRPFRLLARKYGADFCYTEMISSDAIIQNQRRTIGMVDIRDDEHPVGVQLFGSSPENLARAAKMAVALGADLLDINLGCPVKKVVKKNGGAALMKDFALTAEIMTAAAESVPVPVTIKMRTGWAADEDTYLEIARTAQASGIAAITLHPRSRSAGLSGKSDWSKIAALKKEVTIPVIGNGDIRSPQDARAMLDQTGCDAIMIGRAAMANPYIFMQIKTYLIQNEILPDMGPKEKSMMALEHARLMIEQFGEGPGAIRMRKHLAWYSKGFLGGAELRSQLNRINSLSDICALFANYLNSQVSANG